MRIPPILKRLAIAVALWCLTVAPARAGTVTGRPLGPAFGPDPQLALTDSFLTNDGKNLDLTLNFSTPISPPSAFASNSVFGYVFLDTDQSVRTGASLGQLDTALGLGLSGIPSGQVPDGLGVDYVVDLDSAASSVPGKVDVISATSLSTLGAVPITYSTESLSLSIPLTLLTDPVDVKSDVWFGAIVGNSTGPTATLLGVPEPSSLLLAGLAIACIGGSAWARRGSRRRSG
jgi:hypothetical protein